MVGNDAINRWDILGLAYNGSFNVTKVTSAPVGSGELLYDVHDGFKVSFNWDTLENELCDDIILSQSIRYKDNEPKIDNSGSNRTPAYPLARDIHVPRPPQAGPNGPIVDAPQINGMYTSGDWFVEVCAICIQRCWKDETSNDIIGEVHSVRECVRFKFNNRTREVSDIEEGSSTHGDWRKAYDKWMEGVHAGGEKDADWAENYFPHENK
jgi:hypothetical protein